MPNLTLLLDRKPMRVYTLDQPVIRIGRAETMDIVIDNSSLSRRHAEIRQDGETWTLHDLGSSNGTFLNGQRLTAPQPLKPGDEIAFGKFSIFFEHTVPEPLVAGTVAPQQRNPKASGTFVLKPDEVERLHHAAATRRQAQLQWEAGGQRDTFYLERGARAAVLVGTSKLSDLRVPAGPQHHILVIRNPIGFEVRNLSGWYRMRVNRQATRQAVLRSGDVIEVRGLRLTFLDEVG